MTQKNWNKDAEEKWTKIFKSFWISSSVNEEKEVNKEGDQENTENGSKGFKKMNGEVHVIDIDIYLLLVWACEFLQ